MELIIALIVSGIVFLSHSIGSNFAQAPQTTPTPQPSSSVEVLKSSTQIPEQGLITKIIDGDTIIVYIKYPENNEYEERVVRLANINTPETKDPRKPVECMGEQASLEIEQFLDQRVELYKDSTQSEEDRYGRLIRFVATSEQDIGQHMIESGLAHSEPFGDSPHLLLDSYESAQKQAQELQLGLWNPDSCPLGTILK